MLYTDIIFIYFFLPITLIITLFDRSTEYKNLILVLSSVIFFTWGKPFIMALLFLSVIIDYLCGLFIFRTNNIFKKRLLLFLDFISNLSLFIVFGCNFIFSTQNILFVEKKLIPIGIAFYSVRGFSYVFDVYSKRIKAEKNIFCLLTYMVSYHFMLAGPIVRYGDLSVQIRKRNITSDGFSRGLNRLVFGLFKTVIIASALNKLTAAGLNPDEITLTGCWLGMLAFIGQVYFIFTGYIDIVIGLGRLYGFDYKENFSEIRMNRFFTGIAESFNTSLVQFFKDFIITPVSKRKITFCLGIIISAAAMALWYKPQKNFLVAGLAAGILIILEKVILRRILEKAPKIISYIYTLFAVFFIFGIVYFDKLDGFKRWAEGLFGVGENYQLSTAVKNQITQNIFLLVIALLIALPFIRNIIIRKAKVFSEKSESAYAAARIIQTILVFSMLIIYTVYSVNMI